MRGRPFGLPFVFLATCSSKRASSAQGSHLETTECYTFIKVNQMISRVSMTLKISLKSTLLCGLFLAATNLGAQVGQEENSENRAQEKLLDGLNSALVDDFKERREVLTNFQSLEAEFSSEADRKTYQNLISKLGKNQAFAPGKLENGRYYTKIENVLVSVPLVNLFESTISFNDKVFTLKSGESYADMLKRLDTFLDQEVLNDSSTVSVLDLFFSSAHASPNFADKEAFKNILEVNATGAVYLSLSVWQIWRKDTETFKKLLTVIENDMKNVTRTCQDLKDKVGVVDHHNGIKVFGMLNDNTADTLERLSSNDKVDSRLVLRNALAQYASNSGHEHSDDGMMDCRKFFGNVATMMGGTIKMDIDQTCQAFDTSVSCLDELKSTHDEVYSVGRNESLKLYNGKRPFADSNQDAFKGLRSTRGSSR